MKSVRDSYKEYSKSSDNPVDKSLFLKINNEFSKYLCKKLLEEGEIPLPEKLGLVKIVGRKVKVKIKDGKLNLPPNWKATKALWKRDKEAKKQKKLIYFFNENTDRVIYRFYWRRKKVLVSNKTFYDLVMTRNNKRTLAKKIKSGKEYQIK